MTARKIAGYALLASPIWIFMAVGLITDTRDAAIGFGIVLGLVSLMALGVYLLDRE